MMNHPNILEAGEAPRRLLNNRGESPAVKAHRILTENFANRLTFDLDSGSILLDDAPLSLDTLYTLLVEAHELSVPMSNLRSLVSTIARRRSFSPLRRMVEACQIPEGDQTDYLRVCVQEVLHLDNELDYLLFRRFMVGAVARVIQPGCKMDNTLVLQGPQGIGKSTFFEVLAGGDKFGVMAGRIRERESQMLLQSRWFVEWAELETVLGPSGHASVKGFLSTTVDRYRAPYAAEVSEYPRRVVIVGTTNEQQFLTDTTGNRRYWVLSVPGTIDQACLRDIRERVIGTALKLYHSGEQWHLTSEENELLRERLARYEVDPLESEPWDNEVTEWAQSQPEPFMTETLLDAMDVPRERQSTSLGKRIASILKPLGFVKKSRRIPGRVSPRKMWVRETPPTPQ